MRRTSYSPNVLRIGLFALVVACASACSDDTQEHLITDGPPKDAPSDGPGSGSDEMAALEPSPHDRNLELVVIASSLVVAVGPVVGSRRRRTPNIL
jgi:hypothetical protein